MIDAVLNDGQELFLVHDEPDLQDASDIALDDLGFLRFSLPDGARREAPVALGAAFVRAAQRSAGATMILVRGGWQVRRVALQSGGEAV